LRIAHAAFREDFGETRVFETLVELHGRIVRRALEGRAPTATLRLDTGRS
jgi:hypothetical protein